MKYRITLIVKPRPGVRDPQGEAVEDALANNGHLVSVNYVGRVLSFDIEAEEETALHTKILDMCAEMLVNPNIETYEIVKQEELK